VEANLKKSIFMNSEFKHSVAGANCSAVEQRPFQKRVSPKNQRSRGNILIIGE